MSEFQLAVLVYVPLQIVSLLLLPRWWKVAALPGLLAVPGIFEHGGYMGDVIATLFLIIACVYLLLPWSVFGIVRLARRAANPASAGASPAGRFVPMTLLSPLMAAAAIAAAVFVTGVPLHAAFLVAVPAVTASVAGPLLIGGEVGTGRSISLGLFVAALAAAGAWASLLLLASLGWSGAR